MVENIRIIEHQGERVETGVTQFGDDWPGVFIRGDNALGFAAMLRTAERQLLMSPEAHIQLTAGTVRRLRELLASCRA